MTMTISINDIDHMNRAAHLVDIENLLRGPWATISHIEAALAAYCTLSGLETTDAVYVAANPKLAFRVQQLARFSCSVRTRRGANGADTKLLETMTVAQLAGRFGRLVIGSGDGIFLSYAAQARDAGVDVTVIANAGGLHRGYRDLGVTIIEFDGMGPFAA